MIGIILYKAKIVDSKPKMLSWEIIKETRLKYTLDRKYHGVTTIYKDDVVAIFSLTKKIAMIRLISELDHFVELGEDYLKKTKQQLADAKEFKIGDTKDA
jgi:hypothetical protein